MYDEYFGLNESPFDLSTDPRFLYLSPAHARARAYLDYTVYKGDGLVVITGEIGVGKSTLIHDIAAREHQHADVVVIRQPYPDVIEFLQALLLEWGYASVPATRPELLAAVHDELAERFMWGKRTTLIVDEAQTLERQVLEELRMLADRQVGADKPLSIVLVGQPGLRDNLAGEEMEQFRQRVRLSYHLAALDEAETWRYIDKRLEVAGACAGPWPIFREDTIARVHRYTGGIPRLINVLADLSLTAAYLDGADSVGLEQVDSAIEELGWLPYSRRRRQAALAMPGLGFVARSRASIADAGRVLRHGAGAGMARASRATVRWRQRLPGALQQYSGRLGARLSGLQRRAVTQTRSMTASLAGLAASVRVATASWPQRIRQWLQQGPWLTANVVRGAAIVFIGVTTASVVISGSRDGANEAVTKPLLAAVDAVSVPIPTVLRRDAGRAELTAGPSAPSPSQDAGAAPVARAPTQSFLLLDTGPMGDLSRSVREQADDAEARSVAAAGETSSASTGASLAAAPETELAVAGLEGPSWILAQQPESYVIQILAARDRDVVTRFLQGEARELNLAYYRRVRDNEEWHVIVSGLYPNYPSAKQATATLPAGVRKTGPWVRPVSTLQDDIRAASRQLQARAML